MTRFTRLFRLARAPKASQAEIGEELELHLDLRAAELVAEGWTPEAARAEARRLFGSPGRIGQECLTIDRRNARTMRRTGFVDELRQDLAFAIRSFRRRPLFTALAIAILAAGIGATTAVFSLVNAVLLRPLPYRAPAQLVMLQGSDEDGSFTVSERERLRYRAETGVFASVGTWTFGTATVLGGDQPERLRAAAIDADLLPTLGMEPALGRGFTAGEIGPGPAVVILSHGYWQSRWSADPAVLGRSITVNERPMVVVGVMPAEVNLPTDYQGPPVDLYLPLALDPTPDPRNLHYLDAVARLAPRVTIETARPRLDLVSAELAAEIISLPRRFRIAATPVTEYVLGAARPAVMMLMAAVVVLLVLACANVAGLLLANAESRQREFAVRAALGAGGHRLVRQVISESLLLATVGGAAGLILSVLALDGILALSPPNLPRADTVAVDGRVAAVAILATLLTALGAGLIPALRIRRRTLAGSLVAETRATTGGRERHGARRALVLTEVALAITIAVAAGLVGKSWLALLSTSPGFPIGSKLTFVLSLPSVRYPDRGTRWDYYRETIDRLREIPGATSVGAISALPLGDQSGDWGFLIEGRPVPGGSERKPFADRLIATAGYFEAMGVPIEEGRSFEATDDTLHPPVVILSRAVARRYWPNGGALHSRIRLSSDIDSVWRTVVGIAGDVRSRGLEHDPRPEFYFPHAQTPASPNANAAATMAVVVRTNRDPIAVTSEARAVLRRIDPAVPMSRVQTMDRVLEATLSVRRFQLLLLGLFAISALALVAIGVYGVVAFLVHQRTREFGVRLALGADRERILRLVLVDGVRMAAAGVIVGLVGAIASGRLLSGVLYRARAFDPIVLGGVTLLVVAVVVAASLAPAARAARTSPSATLRSD